MHWHEVGAFLPTQCTRLLALGLAHKLGVVPAWRAAVIATQIIILLCLLLNPLMGLSLLLFEGFKETRYYRNSRIQYKIDALAIAQEQLRQRLEPVDPALVRPGETCSICLDTWGTDPVAAPWPCRHGFHVPCAAAWIEGSDLAAPTCPLCRSE